MVRVLPLCFLLVGCSSFTLCPDFPKPNQQVLESIKSLNNPEVDSWIVELYKLNEKLKICKGEK